MSKKISLRAVGVVERASKRKSVVRIFPEYCAGLKGLEGFSHVIILYWMHELDTEKYRQTLLVFPRRHTVSIETGVFSCRSPDRPNPIGLCVAELLDIRGCSLMVRRLDALEASPVIDIKPYVPRVDSVPDARTPEWTENGPST
jgi:tRNA-Thr(GGU) m(6)t(6)A37 methyltransferase TsaA